MKMTSHMKLTSGTTNVNHRCMIKDYIVDRISSIFLHILENLFISTSPNFKTSYYKHSTHLHFNATNSHDWLIYTIGGTTCNEFVINVTINGNATNTRWKPNVFA